MQRSTTVNAQDLCGFLELLLIGLIIIHVFVVVVIFILVAAAGRSISLPLLGLAAASSSAGTFLAGSPSTFLGLLLVAPLQAPPQQHRHRRRKQSGWCRR